MTADPLQPIFGFRRVLIANRGEVARRVIRTCRELGLETVAVFSEADRDAPHVREATVAQPIGASPAIESYLSADALLAAAKVAGADAVHPGYGFLSESPEFARAVLAAGLTWVGPQPEVMSTMASKVQARELAQRLGVPVSLGSTALGTLEELDLASLQYPAMLKAVAGGGGIGMRVVRDETELVTQFASASAQATRYFGDGRMLVESYLSQARHVEVQVLGLGSGAVVVLGDRDCSTQRRHQKLVEEAPAPALDVNLRAALHSASLRIAEAVEYEGVGTVEFLVSPHAPASFVFIEMNTRLQVEHPVTEMVTGLDLVELQLRVAAGLPVEVRYEETGCAIELRVYAEDPVTGFPKAGQLTTYRLPDGDGVRVESGYDEGCQVPSFYDPLLCKLVVHGEDRTQAIERAADALRRMEVEGVPTNANLLLRVLGDEDFTAARHTTALLDSLPVP